MTYYLGKILKVIPESDGKHGAYAVTHVDGFEGTVTFSLNPDDGVWQESYPLVQEKHRNLWVILSKITRKDSGWRAMCVRAYTPQDAEDKTILGKEILEISKK